MGSSFKVKSSHIQNTDTALANSATATNMILTTPNIGAAIGTSLALTTQPYFDAYITATAPADITGDGTIYSLTGDIWTEVVDNTNSFSNGTFTAPSDGVYLFSGTFYITGLTSSHTYTI
jgi:hypothetical protein